jgi:bacteriorhodopsin
MIGLLLAVVLLLVLIAAVPIWPHSRKWGYYPTGGVGVVLMVVVILLLIGRI